MGGIQQKNAKSTRDIKATLKTIVFNGGLMTALVMGAPNYPQKAMKIE